jgi:hypothetical protein
MGDLRQPLLIKAKGLMFLLAGIMAAAMIILENPSWQMAGLLALAVWCFCRFYYFAFYVIEHYVDPSYKFAGLWSFASYMVSRQRHAVAETRKKS